LQFTTVPFTPIKESKVDDIKVLIALAPGSTLLREALRHCLEREIGIRLVGEVYDPLDLLVTVGATEADVVIHDGGGAAEIPAVYTHLFDEYPAVQVLRLTNDCEQALLYRREIVVSPVPAAIDNLASTIFQLHPHSHESLV
jgi:hypothetical protein